MEPQDLDPIRSKYRSTVQVHAALVVSILIYVVVAQVFKATAATDEPFRGVAPHMASDEVFPGWTQIGLLRGLFIVLGAGLAAFAPLLRVRLLARAVRAGARPSVESVAEVLARAHIATAALYEAIGVYGLLLFLLAGSELDLFGFVGVSLALMGLHVPRRTEWEHIAQRAAAD
jgi:hypothetical protein